MAQYGIMVFISMLLMFQTTIGTARSEGRHAAPDPEPSKPSRTPAGAKPEEIWPCLASAKRGDLAKSANDDLATLERTHVADEAAARATGGVKEAEALAKKNRAARTRFAGAYPPPKSASTFIRCEMKTRAQCKGALLRPDARNKRTKQPLTDAELRADWAEELGVGKFTCDKDKAVIKLTTYSAKVGSRTVALPAPTGACIATKGGSREYYCKDSIDPIVLERDGKRPEFSIPTRMPMTARVCLEMQRHNSFRIDDVKDGLGFMPDMDCNKIRETSARAAKKTVKPGEAYPLAPELATRLLNQTAIGIVVPEPTLTAARDRVLRKALEGK